MFLHRLHSPASCGTFAMPGLQRGQVPPPVPARPTTVHDLPRVRIDAGSLHDYITSEPGGVAFRSSCIRFDDADAPECDSCLICLAMEVTRQAITPCITVFQHCGSLIIFRLRLSYVQIVLAA